MTVGSLIVACSTALAFFAGCTAPAFATEALGAGRDKAQITILYDAFGKEPAMQKDWGYAALVEYGGKRILFDTGNNPDVLERNAKAKGVDLSKLDFVVMPHRHGDHMGGLSYLLRVNPRVKIYAPKDLASMAPTCRAAFIARTLLYRRNSAITAVRPPTSCGLDPPGPAQTSNSWIKRSRSLPTSI